MMQKQQKLLRRSGATAIAYSIIRFLATSSQVPLILLVFGLTLTALDKAFCGILSVSRPSGVAIDPPAGPMLCVVAGPFGVPTAVVTAITSASLGDPGSKLHPWLTVIRIRAMNSRRFLTI
jgi:hypothetical protein